MDRRRNAEVLTHDTLAQAAILVVHTSEFCLVDWALLPLSESQTSRHHKDLCHHTSRQPRYRASTTFRPRTPNCNESKPTKCYKEVEITRHPTKSGRVPDCKTSRSWDWNLPVALPVHCVSSGLL